MNLKDLDFGSTVFIDVSNTNSEFTVSTKVFDIKDGDIIVYNAPDDNGNIVILTPEDTIYVRINKGGTMLRWLVEEWQNEIIDGQKFFRLKSSMSGESFNRREAFRLSILSPLRLTETSQRKPIDGVLKDISQTGIGFSTNTKLDLDTLLSFTLSDFGLDVSLVIHIIREELIEGDEKYLYGAMIVKDDSNLQKYIFKKQSEIIRRERHAKTLL